MIQITYTPTAAIVAIPPAAPSVLSMLLNALVIPAIQKIERSILGITPHEDGKIGGRQALACHILPRSAA